MRENTNSNFAPFTEILVVRADLFVLTLNDLRVEVCARGSSILGGFHVPVFSHTQEKFGILARLESYITRFSNLVHAEVTRPVSISLQQFNCFKKHKCSFNAICNLWSTLMIWQIQRVFGKMYQNVDMSFFQSNEMPRMNDTFEHSNSSILDLMHFEEGKSILLARCDKSVITVNVHHLYQRRVKHDNALVPEHSLKRKHCSWVASPPRMSQAGNTRMTHTACTHLAVCVEKFRLIYVMSSWISHGSTVCHCQVLVWCFQWLHHDAEMKRFELPVQRSAHTCRVQFGTWQSRFSFSSQIYLLSSCTLILNSLSASPFDWPVTLQFSIPRYFVLDLLSWKVMPWFLLGFAQNTPDHKHRTKMLYKTRRHSAKISLSVYRQTAKFVWHSFLPQTSWAFQTVFWPTFHTPVQSTKAGQFVLKILHLRVSFVPLNIAIILKTCLPLSVKHKPRGSL